MKTSHCSIYESLQLSYSLWYSTHTLYNYLHSKVKAEKKKDKEEATCIPDDVPIWDFK